MKGGQKIRLGTLRLITAAIKQREVDERIELGNSDIIAILDKMVKQRRESIAQYDKAGREDLSKVEKDELLIIQEFMPQALSDEEIATQVKAAIAESGATDIKGMGKVMSILKPAMAVPDAMGLGLYFETGEGPKFKKPIRNAAQVQQLPDPDPENELRYVMDAVRTIRHELSGKVPLIGFTGSPWTLATYMVEGGTSKDYAHVKGMLFDQPRVLHELLEKTTKTVINYLNAQVAAGAQALMVFDTWGGSLSPSNYLEFSLSYMQKIADAVTRHNEGRAVPLVLFTKNGGQWLDKIADTGCDAVGVDWTTDLATARKLTKDTVALQGNLDPCVLYAKPETIRQEVHKVLKSYGTGPGHVFNLGHGIHQHVNPENLGVMVEAVRELSPAFHSG
ncbi:unnamed protein product [Cyprideis torosa]|uniref:Uroporphyrinogen decarboxylase n=1 Tax=Cyprideis torosa TaxID=163714 RepID=A0A7R8W0L5_9CRUS|nr:unnamed protein product [Cyprideis torosa]CAG0878782.1 unnamed protein product [Cyprideis torosa]